MSGIVALATPRVTSAVFLLRISGYGLLPLLSALCRIEVCRPRYATLVSIYDDDGQVIDTGLLTYFPAPASYTGEDVLEFSGHGNPVVMGAVLARCVSLGLSVAEPGEFTKRAFLNGKIDLTQAEAVADLIHSSSLSQAKAALRSLSGAFRSVLLSFRERLLALRVTVEASIDFVEEHLTIDADVVLHERIARLYDDMLVFRRRIVSGHVLRHGLSIVFVGPPNAGKSSLLNALSHEEMAIVTPIAGTTRDVIRSTIEHQGILFHLADTAGFRSEAVDIVEQIGWDRACKAMDTADVICWVIEAALLGDMLDELLERMADYPSVMHIIIANKSDLIVGPLQFSFFEPPVFQVSAKTGEGLDSLLSAWYAVFQSRLASPVDDVIMARTRHLHCFDQALSDLSAIVPSISWEMMAECLRLASLSCDEILGVAPHDELLDRIFSEFCVGK